jgi:hypothetical protein
LQNQKEGGCLEDLSIGGMIIWSLVLQQLVESVDWICLTLAQDN